MHDPKSKELFNNILKKKWIRNVDRKDYGCFENSPWSKNKEGDDGNNVIWEKG